MGGLLNSGSTFASTIQVVIGYINLTIGVLVPLAIVIFFWGIVRYVYFADNETERERGRNLIIWGLLAIFVLFSIWGILQLLATSFFGGPIQTPSSVSPSYYNTGSTGQYTSSSNAIY